MSPSGLSGKQLPPLATPDLDPTSIFEVFRGSYGSELLTAASAHFGVFSLLHEQPLTPLELGKKLGLAERPAVVLFTALRAMGLLIQDEIGRLALTEMGRDHLIPGTEFYVGDYLGLAANSPGVLAIVQRLKTNSPAHAEKSDTGAAFIYRDGLESAMEDQTSARRLTLALAGRAKNVAPVLAERISWRGPVLLDVGGGTGIYSVAWLRRHPGCRAIVFDRPEVLKIAMEFATEYGVADQLECEPGDMFTSPLPTGANTILLSNILHDWDVPECRQLIQRCAAALAPGGELVIHDVFLNDELDGPLPIALYSAALFSLTEGRAYSAAEYSEWLREAGLIPTTAVLPTLIHCGLLGGIKPAAGKN
jgi:predicted O-methyltransferase YrrM